MKNVIIKKKKHKQKETKKFWSFGAFPKRFNDEWQRVLNQIRDYAFRP